MGGGSPASVTPGGLLQCQIDRIRDFCKPGDLSQPKGIMILGSGGGGNSF